MRRRMKIIEKKKSLGQFYTSNSEYMLGGMCSIIPNGSVVVDPFAGNWDLLRLFENHLCVGFDIDPKVTGTIKQDTLNNVPDYSGKWVVTNPPYLARNKCKDKTIYNKYNVSDLYKAAIKSIVGCVGGILIVPINFLCDLRGTDVRSYFLSKYVIKELRIFEEQVFDDTSYTVCAFSFIRQDNDTQTLMPVIYPEIKKTRKLKICKTEGYVIGGVFYNRLMSSSAKVCIGRLIEGTDVEGFISNIKVRAVDSGSYDKRIKLEIGEHYYGKQSDRVFATLVFSEKVSLSEQYIIVEEFNKEIEKQRSIYHSLFLTNYRNSSQKYARKRISFRLVYDLVNYLVYRNRKGCVADV